MFLIRPATGVELLEELSISGFAVEFFMLSMISLMVELILPEFFLLSSRRRCSRTTSLLSAPSNNSLSPWRLALSRWVAWRSDSDPL